MASSYKSLKWQALQIAPCVTTDFSIWILNFLMRKKNNNRQQKCIIQTRQFALSRRRQRLPNIIWRKIMLFLAQRQWLIVAPKCYFCYGYISWPIVFITFERDGCPLWWPQSSEPLRLGTTNPFQQNQINLFSIMNRINWTNWIRKHHVHVMGIECCQLTTH